MQLRHGTTARVPGRYTEYDIPPSPGVATFVHPTIPYDPGLPPAAFPTLEFPHTMNQLAQTVSVLDPSGSDSRRETDESIPPKRAIVFHDKRILPEAVPLVEQTGSKSSAPSAVVQDALQRVSEKRRGPDGCSCGSFEHLSSKEMEMCPRKYFEDYEGSFEWEEISDGLKLVIVSELSRDGRSFVQVMELLAMPSEYINKLTEIHNQEILRRERENEHITKSQSVQLKSLMEGACSLSRDAFTASLERDLYANLEEPATFIIHKDDIKRASSLLRRLNIVHLPVRLWSFEGVAQSPNILHGPASAEGPEKDARLVPEIVVGDGDFDAQSGEKSKRKTTLPAKHLLEESQVKPSSKGSRIVKLRLPSGLRTAVSCDDLEETVAMKPAALQSLMKYHTQRSRSPTRPRKKAKPTVKYVRRKTKAQTTTPTADNQAATAALKSPPAENDSNNLLTQESGPGEICLPTRSENQTSTKSMLTAAGRGKNSKIVKLQLTRASALKGRTAKMMLRMQDSAIQAAEENQGDGHLKESPMTTLPLRAVSESQPIAKQARSDVRKNEVMNQMEEKTLNIPVFGLNRNATKAADAKLKGQLLLEVIGRENATENDEGDGQENGPTIAVRSTVGPKRKRQHDYADL